MSQFGAFLKVRLPHVAAGAGPATPTPLSAATVKLMQAQQRLCLPTPPSGEGRYDFKLFRAINDQLEREGLGFSTPFPRC